MPVLESLVRDVDEFQAKYWDLVPHVFSQRDLSNLLNVDKLDDLISRRVLRTPSDLRIANDGKTIGHEFYSNSISASNSSVTINSENIVIPELALKCFENGNTLIFQGLNNHLNELNSFCSRLSIELGSKVGANAYLSPHGSKGGMHFDYHDVFIIQLLGKKNWLIKSPKVPRPTEKIASQQDEQGKTVFERTLNVGDVMYMPRGFWHLCDTPDSTSLHLTLSINAQTWADLFKSALDRCVNDSFYRKSLPLELISERPNLDHALERLSADLELFSNQAIDNRIQNLSSRLVYKSPSHLASLVTPIDIGLDNYLSPITPWSWQMYREETQITVMSGLKEMLFPLAMLNCIECFMSGECVRVSELVEGCSDEVLLALSREMIRNGLTNKV